MITHPADNPPFFTTSRVSPAARRWGALVLLAAGGGAAPTAEAQRFDAPVLYPAGPAGSQPRGVALGDVDGDGRPDLVVAVSGANAVRVFRNPPATPGAFGPAATYANVANTPEQLVLADVNGDTWPDLVLALPQGSGVGVMLNTAAAPGTFAPRVLYPTRGEARSVAVGDVNGDGWPDVAALDLVNGGVSVLLNAPAAPGTFAAPGTEYPAGGRSAQGLALADVNGDGWPDLVAGGGGTGRIGVLLHRGTPAGAFAPVVSYGSGGSYPRDVAVGDLNGDGRPDLAVATGNDARVAVLLQSAGAPGTFGAAATYPTGGHGAYRLRLGDVDGDGRPDVVTANYDLFTGAASVGVFLNAAATPGTLRACATFASGGAFTADVAVGDVDGDGPADLAAVNAGSATVGILRNLAPLLATGRASWAAAVRLYPQPVHDRFVLELPAGLGTAPAQLVLVDALGRTVHQEAVRLDAAGTRLAVAPAHLVPGVYALRLQAGPAVLTQRLVVR